MKFLLFLLMPFCYGQNSSSFKLLNKKDSSSISNAHIFIDDKLLQISDSLGIFSLNHEQQFDKIHISHINFEDKLLTYSESIEKDKIFMTPLNHNLEEVNILTKNYEKTSILPKQSVFSKVGYFKGHRANSNSQYATFIPNNDFNEATIEKIIVEPHKGYWGDPDKQFMPFKVNLYSVDTINKIPLKKIIHSSILTRKNDSNNNTQKKYVMVDIRDYNIDFPKEGVYVVVETLSREEYKAYYGISLEPPAFKVIKKMKKSKSYTLSRSFSNIDNTITKNWIDNNLPSPSFIYNFGIRINHNKK